MLARPTNSIALEEDQITTVETTMAQPRSIADDVVEHVLSGHGFLAVTSGSGVRTAASVIEEALIARSVRVMTVHQGDNAELRLKTMAAQLLGKPEADFDPDDIETLFEVLTAHEGSGQRAALIVEDADRLQPDAVSYLCLLSTLAKSAAPQTVFVGRPEFLALVDNDPTSQLGSLITARWAIEADRTNDAPQPIALASDPGGSTPAAAQRPKEPAAPLDRRGGQPDQRVQPDQRNDDSRAALADGARSRQQSGFVRRVALIAGLAVVGVGAYLGGEILTRRIVSALTRTDIASVPDRPVAAPSGHDRVIPAAAPVAAPAAEPVRAATVAQVAPPVAQPAPPSSATASVAAPAAHPERAATNSQMAPPVVQPAPPPPTAVPHAADSALAKPRDLDARAPAAQPPGPAATPSPVGATAVAQVAGPVAQPIASAQPASLPPALVATPTDHTAAKPRDEDAATRVAKQPAPAAAPVAAAVPPMTPPVVQQAPQPPVVVSTPADSAVAKPREADTATPVAKPAAPAAAPVALGGAGLPQQPVPVSPVVPAPPSVTAPSDHGGSGSPAATASAPPPDVRPLLNRGDTMLALGDLTAARLFFEKAASLGNAHAATVLGKTYDPLLLPTTTARGVTANRALAAAWYRRAIALGDGEAGERLEKLNASGTPK